MAAAKAPQWSAAGSDAFILNDGKTILGVLYWAPVTTGFLHGPGGERTDMDAEWMFIFADDPQAHIGLGEGGRDNQQVALDLAEAEYRRRYPEGQG